jgi:hypothetical protein
VSAGASQKHEREAIRLVRAMHPDMHADIERRHGKNAHAWLIATVGETSVRVCCSSSPKAPDAWLRQVRGNVRRAFRDKGLDIPTHH